MSLILKGIDLPEKNKGLYIHIFNGKVEIVHPLDACEVEHTNAEAIQILKGHGRLIDEDEIIMWGADWKKYRGMFDEIPTILEEEE